MRVLLAEDDVNLSEFLSQRLAEERFSVDVASDGAQVKHLAQSANYDLAVLDLNIPHVSFMDLLGRVRAQKSDLLILKLGANDDTEARIEALNAGADDYLTKPFSFAELLARIRALLRRKRNGNDAVLRVADLELDRFRRVVRRGGQPIALSHREFALLELLMLNADQQVSRSVIVEHVWKLPGDAHTNVVDVYVSYLRKKIGSTSGPALIRTVRGVGYQIGAPAEEAKAC